MLFMVPPVLHLIKDRRVNTAVFNSMCVPMEELSIAAHAATDWTKTPFLWCPAALGST